MPNILELKSLVVFDIKLENLQSLLSSIVTTVNQHSDQLKRLSNASGHSVTHSELQSILSRLSASIPRSMGCKVLSTGTLDVSVESLLSGLSSISALLECSQNLEEMLRLSLKELEQNSGNKVNDFKLKK